jgi:hypothetical protein
MMAALVIASLLALAGACFPTRPCISNLRPSASNKTSAEGK